MTGAGAEVAAKLQAINRAWLESRFDDLTPLIHEDIVLVPPGWGGRVVGRDTFIGGLREFMQIAVVHEFDEHDLAVDIIGETAIASYRYAMRYSRNDAGCRATGRDIYVFERTEGSWLAVWRTMVDIEEHTTG